MSATSTLNKKIRECYEEIYQLKDKNGDLIYEIFRVVPDKKIYPDYYDIIAQPTSLNSIKKRFQHYPSPNEFIRDLAQIVWNAKTYNEPESFVYVYAEIIDKYIKETVIPRFASQGFDVGYPDLSPITPTKAGTLIAYNTLPPQLEPPSHISTPVKEDRHSERDLPRRRAAVAAGQITAASNSAVSTPSSYNKDQSYKRGRPPVIDKPFEQRIKNVLRVIKKEKGMDGQLLSLPFERLPDSRDYPDYYNTITEPISLDEIRKKVKQRKYKDVNGFIEDFKTMISNAKYYNEAESPVYKKAVHLEYFFNSVIEEELKKPDSDYIPTDSLKIPLDQLELHGKLYKIGDWILINNANDSSKPIVSQLFRIWQTQDGQRWINVCWYLRAEQTVHRVDRLFYENEVFKSGQYRDHLADEIIGHCYVAYFTRYQRGDPAVNYEGPLFICEYRYNDNDKNFNKIRTWKACLPDEVRDHEDPITPLPNLRLFKKIESPLKHLLPSNATINMPIPEPTIVAANAPPLHGAVYLRDIDETDDLGQYASSRVCPKYIIRPNDPPTTESPSNTTTPIVSYSRNVITAPQQTSSLYHATPTYVPTATSNSFTIPISLEENTAGLIRMDVPNNRRRLAGIQNDVQTEGPLIWFRAPGVNITSRIAPDLNVTGLNRILKRKLNKNEEEERDEEIDVPGRGFLGPVRLGHSAKYLAYKLSKTSEIKN